METGTLTSNTNAVPVGADWTPLGDETFVEQALQMFREEKIGIYGLRVLLGMTRTQVNRFLIDRDEWAQSLTMEDLEADSPTVEPD